MLIFKRVILHHILPLVLSLRRAGLGFDVKNQIRFVRTHLVIVSEMIRVGLRLDEAARKANLKIARLVGSNINRDWDSKRMIKGLENLVHHVAWRDFVFVGSVNGSSI